MGFRAIAGLVFVLLSASTVGGASASEERRAIARDFMNAFLTGDDAKASRLAGRDVAAWRSTLERAIPGEGPFTYFRFLICDLKSKSPVVPVVVRRGTQENVFVVEVADGGRISAFDTVSGRSGEEMARVEAEIAALSRETSAGWTVGTYENDLRRPHAKLLRALSDWSADFEEIFECFALEAKFLQDAKR